MNTFTRAGNYLRQAGKPADGFVLEKRDGDVTVLFPEFKGKQRRRLLHRHRAGDAAHDHVPGTRCQRCAPLPPKSVPLTSPGPRDWSQGKVIPVPGGRVLGRTVRNFRL